VTATFQHPAVCNAGPLIGLARIGLEQLPFDLFAEVVIPEQVRDELLAKDSPDRSKIEAVLARARIHRISIKPDPLLAAELDAGEAAVIASAIELDVNFVLLDERKARKIAAHAYGLSVKGTAGLLVAAKKSEMITAVRPHLEGMIRGGYHLSPTLVAACLEAAGESIA